MCQDYSSGGEQGKNNTIKFFEEEYRLNHLIGTFAKPIVAVIDGIVMGGGVGITMHAPIRIATEKSLFAMPETNIGLIPDVGGSFFLSRLDGYTGVYLGLTGARLKGVELFQAGLATHFIHSSRVDAALQQLKQLGHKPSLLEITSILDSYVADEATNCDWADWSLSGDKRRAIDRCFHHASISDILDALSKEEVCSQWAIATRDTILKMSPSSCKATLRQVRLGQKLDFASCFRLEYQIVKRIMERPDFFEGVNAALIAKTKKPQWNPDWISLETALPDRDLSKAFGFGIVKELGAQVNHHAPEGNVSDAVPGRDLVFTNSRTYFDYPARSVTGLPTERDVQAFIRREVANSNSRASQSREYVTEWFLQNWGSQNTCALFSDYCKELADVRLANSRPGVAPRVAEILERMFPKFTRQSKGASSPKANAKKSPVESREAPGKKDTQESGKPSE